MSHPTIQQMLNAQDIERELRILKDQSEVISIPLERTKARRQHLRRDLQTLKAKLEKMKKDRRQAEVDLSEIENRLNAARGRQSSVRTSKEVQALEHEIEAAQTTADTAENQVLSLMEQEETLTTRIETQSQSLARDLETIDAEIARLSALLQENQDLAGGLREERIAALNRMDEEIRETYEWLVKKHGPASAVSNVSGGACGGCGAMLLPDQMMKIRNADELHRCTHCYRYLITEAD